MKRVLPNMSHEALLDLACASLKNIVLPDNILPASDKLESFGALFGRDAAKIILKFLRIAQRNIELPGISKSWLLDVSKQTLLKLVELQGQKINIESNEEPGKIIHEYRTEGYEDLVNRPQNPNRRWENPWYLYPDGSLRSFDSIDSTPLTLIVLYRYWQVTEDELFLQKILPAVEKGLNWIIDWGDIDHDNLLEYEFKKGRKNGGLLVQNWTDSTATLESKNGRMPKYPIAPVEPQGFAWLALKLWADYYSQDSPDFAQKLSNQAQQMKKRFNETFIFEDKGLNFAAQALDGDKKQIKTITGNPMLLLWASYQHSDGKMESIVEDRYIPDFVKRVFEPDLFDPKAGIRTMSTKSPTFNPGTDSYHNGSFWPVLNGLSHEGLLNFGFTKEAKKLKNASLDMLEYFQTPIELGILDKDGNLAEFDGGKGGCRVQTWTIAVVLDWLTEI